MQNPISHSNLGTHNLNLVDTSYLNSSKMTYKDKRRTRLKKNQFFKRDNNLKEENKRRRVLVLFVERLAI